MKPMAIAEADGSVVEPIAAAEAEDSILKSLPDASLCVLSALATDPEAPLCLPEGQV